MMRLWAMKFYTPMYKKKIKNRKTFQYEFYIFYNGLWGPIDITGIFLCRVCRPTYKKVIREYFNSMAKDLDFLVSLSFIYSLYLWFYEISLATSREINNKIFKWPTTVDASVTIFQKLKCSICCYYIPVKPHQQPHQWPHWVFFFSFSFTINIFPIIIPS